MESDKIVLSVDNLKWVQQQLSKDEKRLLYSALQSSTIELPKPVFPARNPQLERRCEKLRIQQDEREYRKMTRNIRESEFEEKPLSLQFKEGMSKVSQSARKKLSKANSIINRKS